MVVLVQLLANMHKHNLTRFELTKKEKDVNLKMRTTLYVQHGVVDWVGKHLQHHN